VTDVPNGRYYFDTARGELARAGAKIFLACNRGAGVGQEWLALTIAVYSAFEEKWRRGESEYSRVLKTRNLLIFRDAKNAENGKIAPNWNASGTRTFLPTGPIS